MSGTEMLNNFNVLYNNITSNQAPGLNSYEIDLFLTKAQYQLLEEQFNHRTDVTNGGYDRSEKRQIDFSPLITTQRLTSVWSEETGYNKIDRRSVLFDVEAYAGNMLFVLDEFLEKTTTDASSRSIVTTYTVIPLSYDNYASVMRKAYKYPAKSCAWRLINNKAADTSSEPAVPKKQIHELIAKGLTNDDTLTYVIKYIRRPYPIIVELLDGVTIENKTQPFSSSSACELPEEFHQEIVERAATLAKIAWQGSTSTIVEAAQRKND